MFDVIPEGQRDLVRDVLGQTFGGSRVEALVSVTGGASGATTWKVESGGRSYLMRIEGKRSPLRNPHQYACMQIASNAGIAPALRYVDAERGIAVMDFVPQQPLDNFPGGAPAAARAVGSLIAKLQATPTFPQLGDYLSLLDRMVAYISGSGLFAAGVFDGHVAAYRRVRDGYRSDATTVSSHNDPNPRNLLFDGERLWLIDWETAYRNDPLVDIAITVDQLATTPELETLLLEAWLGRGPDRLLKARLTLMRVLTRFYYAGLLFAGIAAMPRSGPLESLAAPAPADFQAAVRDGRLVAGAPETALTLGKVMLAQFLAGCEAPGFAEALAISEAG
jgi:aminoglycoside phosphotransferase (APT) family kinase protein